jgi:ElaB/YqjD/DUF883 family membrane-anchored ribosome-binding protein
MVAVVSDEAKLRERVATLENEFKHIDEKLDTMGKTLQELHDVFMQAKGVKWVLIGVAGFVGFLTGILGWLLPWWFNGR